MDRNTVKIVTICLFLSMIAWLTPSVVMAGNPPALFNRPVRLDPSGRPLYNSWERQEHDRRQRPQQARSPRENPDESEARNSGAASPVNAADSNTATTSQPSATTRAAGSSALQGASGPALPVSTSPDTLR